MMKFGKIIAIIALIAGCSSLAQANNNLVGRWTTYDDKTGNKRSIVNLSVENNTLSGTIVEVFAQNDDTGVCRKCPGNFRDQKIQGLQFVWGLKDLGNGIWGNGKILDPKSGKIYNAKISLKGDELQVRGYIGVSALGRTQVWKR